MHRWKKIVFDGTLALNIMLLFLFIFDSRLHVPPWLQVAGRMHTLFLHFPIVMLALCIFWELFSGYNKSYVNVKSEIGDDLLLAAALTSVITALMGLFLSREPGYTPDLLVWHKWGGIFISFLSLIWYMLRTKVRQARPALFVTSFGAMVMIIITGHLGGNITHGQDFIFEPVNPAKQAAPVLFEDAFVYANMVQPILEAKCISCHNAQKAKGELVMETKDFLVKGGKDGKLWDTTEADLGLLMQRIHLPLESRKHMPPQGKPQLTDDEIAILYHWIKSGASFTTKVDSLPQKDTLRLLAMPLFQTIETDDYTFDPPDEKKVQALNNNYRVVKPLAIGSPALGVEFFSKEQFQSQQLKDLLDVKNQIVTLNLNKMPVKDEDLKTVAQFANLRKLNLSFTDITGATLQELSKLKELKVLSLSGTNIKAANLQSLAGLKKLSHLVVWDVTLSAAELNTLQQRLKTTAIETGFKGDTVLIKLNPPLIENEEQVISGTQPLQLKHYINGVTIRYTTDGTTPDSISSPIYKPGIMLDKKEVIKARAFKAGWIGSDEVEKIFYKAGVQPDSVSLLTQSDPQYKGDGSLTLHDGKLGSKNFRDGKWLATHGVPMEVLFYFKNPTSVSSVNISSIVDINSYLMPPQEIEVWGGSNISSLQLLKRLRPSQPSKEAPLYITGYDVDFKKSSINVLKLVVKPVSKLPAWHRGKGDKGWFFTDEVILN
jgi:uncharacterized membrane protein/mono/diheme cytochrome c family protein